MEAVLRQGQTETSGSLREFHEALLPATLANALRTPFYQERYREFDIGSLGLDEFDCLPFVSKREVRLAGDRARNRDGQLCDEIFSGGTTGDCFVTLKGSREQAYIRKFYRHVFDAEYSRPLKRALQINNPYHGHLVAIPVPMYSHKLGIYDAGSFAYGRRLLSHRFEGEEAEERCTLLVGLERALRAFTREAQRDTQGPPDHSLQAIISYSQYLTPSWRRRHESFWGCPVLDRFGMSEVFGGATEEPACGWYFFDAVTLAEVVVPQGDTAIMEGMGELVLTALYPFQEVQPLIRYRTGDLVEVTHSRSSRPGRLAIKPLGRMRYGVRREPDSSEFLLTPNEIFEVMDEIDNLARMPRFQDSPQVSDPVSIGHPIYATSAQYLGNKVQVNFQVAIAGICSNEQCRRAVEEGLLQRSPTFAAAVEEGSADLCVQVCDFIAPDLISHAD